MIRRFLLKSLPAVPVSLLIVLLSSCTVDENAVLTTAGSAVGEGKKSRKTEVHTSPGPLTWSEKRKAALERRAVEREEQAAATAKAEAAEAKKLAAAKKVEEAAQRKAARDAERRFAAEEKARADAEAAELAEAAAEAEAKAKARAEKVAAAKKFREDAIAAREQKREEARLSKIEAKKRLEEERAARAASHEVSAARSHRGGGGFFSLLSIGTTPKQYQSEGHDVYVNEMVLPTLNPSNAQIVISLAEQRARVYRRDGAAQTLVIDTRISSGKPGYATSTGSYRISEKLVEKQSTLYGTWVNSAGETVNSSGDSRRRPPGASRFVGADMPYWMRINGGIGLHIGYVPDYPASHGCIRVPEAIQPLIYSKVGLGTQVTVSH